MCTINFVTVCMHGCIPSEAIVLMFRLDAPTILRVLAASVSISVHMQLTIKSHCEYYILFSFTVGATTGQISTSGPLDHESRSEYHLTLVAQDGTRTGSTPHRTTTLIVVRVTDVNDNSPILRPTTHTAFLTEGQTYNNFLFVHVSSSTDVILSLVCQVL